MRRIRSTNEITREKMTTVSDAEEDHRASPENGGNREAQQEPALPRGNLAPAIGLHGDSQQHERCNAGQNRLSHRQRPGQHRMGRLQGTVPVCARQRGCQRLMGQCHDARNGGDDPQQPPRLLVERCGRISRCRRLDRLRVKRGVQASYLGDEG